MNDDLISRSELKKQFGYTDEWYKGRTVCAIIDNAPTVPLPDFKEGYKQAILDGKTNFSKPQGEWVVVGRAAYGYVDIECPCCKHLRSDIQADNKPNFCENCGADMRKGGEEV